MMSTLSKATRTQIDLVIGFDDEVNLVIGSVDEVDLVIGSDNEVDLASSSLSLDPGKAESRVFYFCCARSSRAVFFTFLYVGGTI